jgi:biotin operon repressor
MFMITKETILSHAKEKGKVYAADLTSQFSISRQYINRLINDLIKSGELLKIGHTRGAYYVLPEYAEQHPEIVQAGYKNTFQNKDLEEDKILAEVERALPELQTLPRNINSIFRFAFTEMLNNAIEHSQSETVTVGVSLLGKLLSFKIEDKGIGVFRNVMQQNHLASELEAIQDILKGKATTQPTNHSGEGIFFTSKCPDLFLLDSYGYQLITDNLISDVFIKQVAKINQGTQVSFRIHKDSNRQIIDVFNAFTDAESENGFAFDKTVVKIKLFALGTEYISRSQARRVLADLEKFKVIHFDFDRVEMVGQAFADEIFRVFHNRHPEIRIEVENMNEVVKFMVQRAMTKGA